MAVFDAGRGRYTLIQNHEIDPGAEFGVPHVKGTVYDPGAVDAGGCTVITTDRAGRNLGEFVAHLRHHLQLRRRADPVGDLADLRGDRGPGRGTWEEGGRTGVFQKDHGYVFEVWADGTRGPEADQVPGPLRPRGPGDRQGPHPRLPLRGRRRAQRPLLPLDRAARRQARPGRAHPPRPGRRHLAAMQIIMDDGSVLPDVAYLTSAQLGRPFPVRWIEVPDRDARTTSGPRAVRRRPGHPRTQVRGRVGHRRGRVRRQLLRLGGRRPAGGRGAARRHGLVLQLPGQDHPAGHVLPAPEPPPRRARRRSTTTSTSTARTT